MRERSHNDSIKFQLSAQRILSPGAQFFDLCHISIAADPANVQYQVPSKINPTLSLRSHFFFLPLARST